jgi:hypothetical protein
MMRSIEYQTSDGKVHMYTNFWRTIDLSHKKITNIIRINGSVDDVEILYLNDNLLESMMGTQSDGIGQFTSLRWLHLSSNRIKRIEGLENLTNLRTLFLDENLIERIDGLKNQTELRELHLNDNLIERIEGFENLNSLEELSLGQNRIKLIEGIENLVVLRQLHLYDNPVKEVPLTIMNLRNLFSITIGLTGRHSVNDRVFVNPAIRRFLSRNLIKFKENRTIYDDPQNVHDSQINRSIRESLYSLMTETKIVMSDEMVMHEIIRDNVLLEQIKQQIVEYCRSSDVHSALNVTFIEALQVIWQIIRSHERSDEIKKILNQEMQDSICRCFTGRLARLVNCLNGFDQRVRIKISDSQEISNIIIAIKQKYDKLDDQIVAVKREMTTRGYSNVTIDHWVGYLE